MTEGGTAPDIVREPGRRRAERPPRRLSAGNLGKPPLPRISLQSTFWRVTFAGTGLLLLLAWFIWYATTPEELPTSEKTVSAPGVAGTPLYVGMFSAPDDLGRTLRISGVKVHATTSADLEVTPLLCRRGTVGVTTGPEQFCSELIDPEGQRLVGGDSIVLKFEASEPVIAVVDQLRIAYREDVRWDTQPAGNEQAIVTFSARPDVEDDAMAE